MEAPPKSNGERDILRVTLGRMEHPRTLVNSAPVRAPFAIDVGRSIGYSQARSSVGSLMRPPSPG
jgi:hypothetical protein